MGYHSTKKLITSNTTSRQEISSTQKELARNKFKKPSVEIFEVDSTQIDNEIKIIKGNQLTEENSDVDQIHFDKPFKKQKTVELIQSNPTNTIEKQFLGLSQGKEKELDSYDSYSVRGEPFFEKYDIQELFKTLPRN